MEPSKEEITEFFHQKLRSGASSDSVQPFRPDWRYFSSCLSHEKPKLYFEV